MVSVGRRRRLGKFDEHAERVGRADLQHTVGRTERHAVLGQSVLDGGQIGDGDAETGEMRRLDDVEAGRHVQPLGRQRRIEHRDDAAAGIDAEPPLRLGHVFGPMQLAEEIG